MLRFPLYASLFAFTVLCACNSGSGSSPVPQPTVEPANTIANTYTAGVSAGAGLYHMAVGPDGRIWFSEFSKDNVGAVTMAGVVSEYSMPVLSQPNGITLGPDGNLWTGGYGGVILKVTTAGTFTAYPIAGAHIDTLVVGPDNNIWFTDYGNNKVGFATTAGAITEFAIPPGASPGGIAKGPDGNLWVADGNGSILKVSTAGVVTQYTTGLTATGAPNEIVAAPDGNLYFTEPFFNATKPDKIGKVTTAGTITELGSIAPQSYPAVISVGGDGNLYFTEYNAGNLGRLTLGTSAISEFALAFVHGSSGIVAGPNGTLWVGANDHIYTVAY